MKKVFFAVIFFMGISVMADAQDIEKFRTFSVETMKMVNASQKQIDEFLSLKRKVEEMRRFVVKDKTLSADEKKEKKEGIKKYMSKTYFREILTPDQAKEVRALQKKVIKARKKRDEQRLKD